MAVPDYSHARENLFGSKTKLRSRSGATPVLLGEVACPAVLAAADQHEAVDVLEPMQLAAAYDAPSLKFPAFG